VEFKYQTLYRIWPCVSLQGCWRHYSQGQDEEEVSAPLILSLLGYNLFPVASTELIEIAHELSVIRLSGRLL